MEKTVVQHRKPMNLKTNMHSNAPLFYNPVCPNLLFKLVVGAKFT